MRSQRYRPRGLFKEAKQTDGTSSWVVPSLHQLSSPLTASVNEIILIRNKDLKVIVFMMHYLIITDNH